jgi:methyl-accepting chemotaxis protein
MIEKSAQQIGQIIGVIDEIAFQTNLLALNAGVEAARAGDVKDIAEVVEQISKSAEEEATGLQEVNSAMGRLDQVTQQNAAMAEESSAASQSLAEQGARLAQLISQFRIERSAEDPIERELKKAAPHAFRLADAPDAGRRGSARASAPAARPRRVGAARSAAENHDWTEF